MKPIWPYSQAAFKKMYVLAKDGAIFAYRELPISPIQAEIVTFDSGLASKILPYGRNHL